MNPKNNNAEMKMGNAICEYSRQESCLDRKLFNNFSRPHKLQSQLTTLLIKCKRRNNQEL